MINLSRFYPCFIFAALTMVLILPEVQALEKLKLGTAIKTTPAYYLPIMAAEDKGYWKENGLEAEWVPFRSSVDLQKGVVAGAILTGLDTATGLIQGASRGVPALIVSDLQAVDGVALYVLPNSPIKDPKELKGARIGITRLGSTDHANARFVAKVLGIEKDVRYVGTGGIAEKMAALRTGAIDTFTIFMFPIMNLRVKGEVRELVRFDDYRPKEWMAHVAFSHKEFLRPRADTVRRMVKALLQGVGHIKQDPDWARDTMKKVQGYTEEAARQTYPVLQFTKDGRIDPKALNNVRNFLMEYDIVPKDKMLPADQLYTREFTG